MYREQRPQIGRSIVQVRLFSKAGLSLLNKRGLLVLQPSALCLGSTSACLPVECLLPGFHK